MLTHPLPGYPISKNGEFGASRKYLGLGPHTGVDWSAPAGRPVRSAGGGRVTRSGGPLRLEGNYIIIDHGGGIETYYGHLLSRFVRAGQFVQAGQTIGAVGATGMTTGNHLHFEVRINGRAVDPLPHVGEGAAVPSGIRAETQARECMKLLPMLVAGIPIYERRPTNPDGSCPAGFVSVAEGAGSPLALVGLALPALLEPAFNIAILAGAAALVVVGVRRALS